MVEELTGDEDLAQQIGWQQLGPAASRSADLDLSYVITELVAERIPGLPLRSRSMVSHPNSFEIRGFLRARIGWYSQAIRDAEKLQGEMSDLRTLIRADLDART